MDRLLLAFEYVWGWLTFAGTILNDHAVEIGFATLYTATVLLVAAVPFFAWRKRKGFINWWKTPRTKTQGVIIMGKVRRKEALRLIFAQAHADALMKLHFSGVITAEEANEQFRTAARSMGWWELCPRHLKLSAGKCPEVLKAEIMDRILPVNKGWLGSKTRKIVVNRVPIPDEAAVAAKRTQKRLAHSKKEPKASGVMSLLPQAA